MKTIIQFIATVLLLHLSLHDTGATITYEVSKAYGGSGGQQFILPEGMAYPYLSQITTMKKVSLKVSHRIEKIQVTWGQRNGQDLVQATGENGGTWKYFHLARGEFITRVTGKTGRFVNQLTFYTNFGRKYGPYGSGIGQPFNILVPKGYEVMGFTGNSGQCIDKLALVYKVDDRKTGRQARPNGRPGPPAHCNVPPARPSKTQSESKGGRPAGNRQVRDHRPSPARSGTIDHRKQSNGKTGKSGKRENTVDHRKKGDAEYRKWLEKNHIDPDRVEG